MIRLAISKGRILEQAIQILHKNNINCKLDPLDTRKLIIPTSMKNVEIVVIKASDVPVYIDSGKVDIGIVGIDTLLEDSIANHYRLLDLQIAKCKLVVAGKPNTAYFNNMKIATKYPNIAKKYFEEIGLQCSILKLYGSIELAPVLSLSDFVVDIVESGKTLQENGLKEFDKIFDISSLLIANKVSYKIKKEEINSFIDRVKSHDK
jgi:ATP phosphoribosyltransferase